jgi:hypothetical protein
VRGFAKLPVEVAGEMEGSPYEGSGELFEYEAESSAKTSCSCGRSTLLRLLRAVRTTSVSLGTRERGRERAGDMSRRSMAGASYVVDLLNCGLGDMPLSSSKLVTSPTRPETALFDLIEGRVSTGGGPSS